MEWKHESMDPMSWEDAELLAAQHMHWMGFNDAALTRRGADGGIDVQSDGGVAQVKHYTGSPVGAPVIQQIRGAGHKRGHVLVYALSGFTAQALRYGEAAGVALFTYDLAGTVTPATSHAVSLVNYGYRPPQFGSTTVARAVFLRSLAEWAQSSVDVMAAAAQAALERHRAEPSDVTVMALQAAQRGWAIAENLNRRAPIGEFASEIARVDGFAQEVCDTLGLDYASVAAQVAGSRAASDKPGPSATEPTTNDRS